MDIAEIFALAYWPLGIAAAIGLVVAWRKWVTSAGPRAIVGFLFVGLSLEYFSFLDPLSDLSRHGDGNINLLVVLLGAGLVVVAFLLARKGANVVGTVLGVLMTFVFGVAGIGFGGERLAGDLFAPTGIVNGIVAQKYVGGYKWQSPHVVIAGRDFTATYDVYEIVAPGMRVRARFTAGSGRVFEVEMEQTAAD